MSIPNNADYGLVGEVSQEIVSQLAHEELPLFPYMLKTFKSHPLALDTGESKDEVLGFGIDGAVNVITPVVLAVVLDVVNQLTGELGSSVVKGGWKATRLAVRRVFGRDRECADGDVPKLSAPQLERVRLLALARAKDLKLSETRANLLADAIVGSLVTTDRRPPNSKDRSS